jgi:hypothetical protein|tara:strand:- start:757 stop:1446 length:690 start_codon:yes stop_codon:yes gene_type:complete
MIKNSKEPESIYDVISKEWKKEKEIRPKRDQYSFFKKLITNLLKETDYRQKIEEMGITQFKHLHDTKTDEYHLYSEFTQTQDSQSNTPIYKRTDEIERLDVEYLIPDEKGIAELYVTCLRYEERGIDVKELDELTDLLKAVEPCSTKESGIPYYISKWGKEVVRILLKGGRMKHQDILLELQELPNKFPVSYTHISKIFKSTRAKKFFRDEIVNDNSYYSLKNPAKFKL